MLPDEIKKYIEASKEEAKWKRVKEGLRPSILQQLKENNYEGIHWSKTKSFKFYPDKLYEFVKSKVSPEVLESVTIRSIDESKLDDLYADHWFEVEDIPEEAYEGGKYTDRINITREKKQ